MQKGHASSLLIVHKDWRRTRSKSRCSRSATLLWSFEIPHCAYISCCVLVFASLITQILVSLDESAQLQEAIEQTLEQKQELETAAVQQAQMIEELERARQELEKTNKALTARAEALERDAKLASVRMPAPATAPNAEDAETRKKLEEQLAKALADLEEQKDVLERTSMAESSQKM